MLTQLRRKREEGGFTLIELLIVIIILGILAAVVVLSINAIRNRGTEAACETEGEQIRVALAAYYSDNEAYPANIADIAGDLDGDITARWELIGTDTTVYELQGVAGERCEAITGLSPSSGVGG